MDNDSIIPPEIKRWNWGAFWLNWIWGIFNGVYIAFLCFVPFVNLVMPFILGAKGNEWAWRQKKWASVEDFKNIQKKWSFWGWMVVMITFVLFLILSTTIFFSVTALLKNSDSYQFALKQVRQNETAIELLGEPIKEGWWVMGNMEVNGHTGQADISFPVYGSKSEGRVYVKAFKDLDEWEFERIVVKTKEGTSLDLTP